MKFYAPKLSEHVSWSIENLQATQDYFLADCKKLSTIMSDLGHTHLDLLKLDIEGAEHAVLENMMKEKIVPTILCVEFDEVIVTNRYDKAICQIAALLRYGYALVDEKDWNFTFLNSKDKYLRVRQYLIFLRMLLWNFIKIMLKILRYPIQTQLDGSHA